MQLSTFLALAVLGWSIPSTIHGTAGAEIQRRQDATDSSLPSLSSAIPSLTTDGPSSQGETSSSVGETTTQASTSATSGGNTASTQASTSSHISLTSTALPGPSSTVSTNSTSPLDDADELPLEPRITPAFGIAGVFLIVSGGVYALIGVKSRWVQIFLSCGFLASIATTALVDYVMNPPVTDAVQGGFFVAIFMTGAVFGGGALVFKEYTEGFGCLLGGFCFSMWLLTLRPGGLITSPSGKGVFIALLCLFSWALSWFPITRPYALIASTAFSGATAFTLGVDCFTRAGMKEFWFYIWDLNDNLFPLDVRTYPLTKGIRVEIAIIAIGTIIGVLSQMKLWKVIRSKQREEEVLGEKDEERREAMEAALGRHLERQNEREKSEWEKQYGDRLQSKRNTLLWQNPTQPEKRYSAVSVVEVQPTTPAGSAESLEMNAFGPKRASAVYSSKAKRQSSVTVDVIEEEEENPDTIASIERQKALNALDSGEGSDEGNQSGVSSETPVKHRTWNDRALQRRSNGPPAAKIAQSSKYNRGSRQSLSGPSKDISSNIYASSQSQEHLVDDERTYSRASSAAATMDEDNEDLDLQSLGADTVQTAYFAPEIVLSPVDGGGQVVLEMPGTLDQSSCNGDHGSSSILATNTENVQVLPTIANTHSAMNRSDARAELDGEKPAGSTRGASKPHSQESEGSNLTAGSLTPTALSKIPSQLSNVVLSYRTNEWAKHIATADAPIYDEPEPIENADGELPTQLAPLTPASDSEVAVNQKAIEVPAAEPLPPAVKSGDSGVGVASERIGAQPSLAGRERRQSMGRPMPSRSASSQTLKNSSKRGSRTAFNSASTPSLVATPIDENAPAEFPKSKRTSLQHSVVPPYTMPHRSSSASLVGSGEMRPYTSNGVAIPYSGSSYDLSRPASQHIQTPNPNTGTRMEHHNSHQPPRRDHRSDAEKRESLLAEWRLSQHRQSLNTGSSGALAEAGRAHMKANKENQKLMEEYQRNAQVQKQQVMDQVMRRPDMQELHREAMRKMQANVNKKLR